MIKTEKIVETYREEPTKQNKRNKNTAYSLMKRKKKGAPRQRERLYCRRESLSKNNGAQMPGHVPHTTLIWPSQAQKATKKHTITSLKEMRKRKGTTHAFLEVCRKGTFGNHKKSLGRCERTKVSISNATKLQKNGDVMRLTSQSTRQQGNQIA